MINKVLSNRDLTFQKYQS